MGRKRGIGAALLAAAYRAAEQIAHASQLIEADGKSVAEIARLLGVHRGAPFTGP